MTITSRFACANAVRSSWIAWPIDNQPTFARRSLHLYAFSHLHHESSEEARRRVEPWCLGAYPALGLLGWSSGLRPRSTPRSLFAALPPVVPVLTYVIPLLSVCKGGPEIALHFVSGEGALAGVAEQLMHDILRGCQWGRRGWWSGGRAQGSCGRTGRILYAFCSACCRLNKHIALASMVYRYGGLPICAPCIKIRPRHRLGMCWSVLDLSWNRPKLSAVLGAAVF